MRDIWDSIWLAHNNRGNPLSAKERREWIRGEDEGWVLQFKRIEDWSSVKEAMKKDDDATVDCRLKLLLLDPWHSDRILLACSNRWRINPYRTRFRRNPTSRIINSCLADQSTDWLANGPVSSLLVPHPLSNDAISVGLWVWIWSGLFSSKLITQQQRRKTARIVSGLKGTDVALCKKE